MRVGVRDLRPGDRFLWEQDTVTVVNVVVNPNSVDVTLRYDFDELVDTETFASWAELDLMR